MVLCPISPAIPFIPSQIFPFRTIPLPTPVPSVNISSEFTPSFFPFPTTHSARAARLASFSTTTGSPSPSCTADRNSNPSNPGRFGGFRNRPSGNSSGPGEPIAMPRNSNLEECKSTSLRMPEHMSPTTASRPACTRAGIWIVSRKPEEGEYAAIRRLVPPKSTPIE